MDLYCQAAWLSGATHTPLAAVARRRRFPFDRGLSSDFRVACKSGGDAPAERDRKWYNPERWKKRRLYTGPKPVRRWVQAEDSPFLDDPSKERFLLVSFNILGDYNASNHRDLYWKVPSDIMKWESRRELIFHEINGWNADLVCLQEVDRFDDIMTNMKRKGYAGSHKRRTGGAKDGCAIFWKEKQFRILEEDSIEFKTFGLRDNVAQLLVFELYGADSRRIVVGNVHVLFNPKRGDIKLGQIRTFLMKANTLSEKWGRVPVVLAGDFNSTPESAIYKFLSTSELDIAFCDRRHLSGQENFQFSLYDLPSCMDCRSTSQVFNKAIGISSITQITHPLKLHSSYASVKDNARTRDLRGEPLATSYHSKFLGTVDYIWHSRGLACTRVLDTLPLDELKKLGSLPCKDIGSDHLALVVELKFADSAELDQEVPIITEEEKKILGT